MQNNSKFLHIPRNPIVEEEERILNKKQVNCPHTKYFIQCSICKMILGSEVGFTSTPHNHEEILINS
jgi:hypothetical protein